MIAFVIILLSLTIVPSPTVRVTAPHDQIIYQPLTLQCEMTSVRGITSRVSFEWSSGGMVYERLDSATSTAVDSSLVYRHSYTIPKLSTTDNGRVIQCEVVINASPLVTDSDSITLDVTGEGDDSLE